MQTWTQRCDHVLSASPPPFLSSWRPDRASPFPPHLLLPQTTTMLVTVLALSQQVMHNYHLPPLHLRLRRESFLTNFILFSQCPLDLGFKSVAGTEYLPPGTLKNAWCFPLLARPPGLA
jgi:hypothetical protein